MFRVEWPDHVVDDIAKRLWASAGLNEAGASRIHDVVLAILNRETGIPVVESELEPERVVALGIRLISDALRRTFPVQLGESDWPGLEVREQSGSYIPIYTDRVMLNVATKEELAELPMIGPRIADAIVSERRANGPFHSPAALAKRIDGISETSSEVIARLVSWSAQTTHSRASLTLEECVQRLVASDPQRELCLSRVLEAAAVIPRPTDQWLENRIRAIDKPNVEYSATTIHVLRGTSYYYRLIDELNAAEDSIFIAMFHAAFPKEDHPTRKILDALSARASAGVTVKVLLDRDRPMDPYGSTIINTAAARYLRDHNVQVHVDTAEHLLHSKTIVIDDAKFFIGSHNWSAGSYFQFEDLTVLVESRPAAASLRARISSLWDQGEPP
jgi:hypothetical protein